MTSAKRFEELECWQTARKLNKEIYLAPREVKDFGFTNQIRRASLSIVSNIAEGFESRTQILFIDYLGRAKASAGEVRAQLHVGKDLQYFTDQSSSELIQLVEFTSRQIYKLIKYLETLPNKHRISEDGSTYLI
jgi:four helix bundle protein